MAMLDDDLQEVADGNRGMTSPEREWAISHHDWLFEYVRTQDRQKRDALSDADLAQEVMDASCDYVKCNS